MQDAVAGQVLMRDRQVLTADEAAANDQTLGIFLNPKGLDHRDFQTKRKLGAFKVQLLDKT